MEIAWIGINWTRTDIALPLAIQTRAHRIDRVGVHVLVFLFQFLVWETGFVVTVHDKEEGDGAQ